jgi:hypothetical protein
MTLLLRSITLAALLLWPLSGVERVAMEGSLTTGPVDGASFDRSHQALVPHCELFVLFWWTLPVRPDWLRWFTLNLPPLRIFIFACRRFRRLWCTFMERSQVCDAF